MGERPSSAEGTDLLDRTCLGRSRPCKTAESGREDKITQRPGETRRPMSRGEERRRAFIFEIREKPAVTAWPQPLPCTVCTTCTVHPSQNHLNSDPILQNGHLPSGGEFNNQISITFGRTISSIKPTCEPPTTLSLRLANASECPGSASGTCECNLNQMREVRLVCIPTRSALIKRQTRPGSILDTLCTLPLDANDLPISASHAHAGMLRFPRLQVFSMVLCGVSACFVDAPINEFLSTFRACWAGACDCAGILASNVRLSCTSR